MYKESSISLKFLIFILQLFCFPFPILLYFEKEFKTKINWFRDANGVPFSLDTPLVDYLISLYKSSIPLAEKIKIIENFRNRYETSVPYAKEVYN